MSQIELASAGQRAAGWGVATGRRAAASIAVVSAVWALALVKTVQAGATVPWDAKNQFYAFFRFLADALHSGQSPFWNPYHYGGHPSLADPQSLILSPLFLIWARLDPAPSMLTFDVLVYCHLLVGGIAMVALGERRGWPASATVLAAAIFMLGASASARLDHTGIIAVYGLLPVALLALEIALERKSAWAALGFGVVASVILVGRNQVALLISIVLVVMAVREAVWSGRPISYLAERWRVLGIMAATIVAMSAIPLLLTLQFASLSNRPHMALATALEASLHPANLITLAVPDAFGSQTPDLAYWGPNDRAAPGSAATDVSFNYLFIGAVPVTLLLWLGIAGGTLAKPGARTWLGVLAGALAFAAGRYTPLFALLFEHVPGFSFFRRPNDGTFVAGAALAFLAGHVIADFVQNGRPPLRRWLAAGVGVGCLAIVGSALSIASFSHHVPTLLRQLGGVVPLVIVTVFIIRWARTADKRAVAAGLIVAFSVGELVTWNAASPLNAEAASYYRLLERPAFHEPHALDALRRDLARRQREGARPRVEISGLGGPWQNVGTAFRMETTTGYNPLRIGLYDRFVAPGESPLSEDGRQFPASFSSYDSALAKALGIEYLVLDRPIEKLANLKKAPKVEANLQDGPEVWIYRLAAGRPRVTFQPRVRVADVDAVSFGGALRNPPRSDLAVIDDETPPSRLAWLNRGAVAGARASIAHWETGRVVIDVSSKAPGVVVLHDIYYPGWVADVDGRPTPVLRADVLFRAVEVPAGAHRITFRFAPLSIENLIDAWARLTSRRPHPVDEDWDDTY